MTRIPVSVFFALFTVSGFAGLIYESIWSHYLKLFLGHAAYAQTLVLAIFMGGMAIGAWLVGHFTHRIRNLLLGYAVAELGIGILALVFHRAFVGLTAWSFDSVLPALGAGFAVDLFKWTLAAAVILPASVLLGTTFPLMSGGLIRLHPDASGRSLSMLYFTNSFGAAAGVLASGFVLIDRVGLPGTIMAAGLLNVGLALTVWLLARTPAGAAAEAPAASQARSAGPLQKAVLAVAVATGAASFIYEITWIRMLSLGLGASTHSFEVMLAAFILGMSAGAFWLRHRLAAIADHVAWLAWLLMAKALLAIAAIWVYSDVLEFIAWMMQATARSDGGYTLTTFAGFAASAAVMFPTAFCAGMSLPLATYLLARRGSGESVIGKVYAANTAGCIVGAAFATHVGLEAFGVKYLTGFGALLDSGAAVLLLAAAGTFAARRSLALGVVAVFAAGALAFGFARLDLLRMASGVFRYGAFIAPEDGKVLAYRDGKTATISVLELGKLRSIRTNGKPDAGIEFDPDKPITEDEPTMTLVAALPLSMRPDARKVANIGFGSGLTTHSLLASPRIERVDTIEIERAMIEGARLFHPRNARAYSDPRSHLHVEDAKTFFAANGTRYDIIVSEPSNVWVSGISTLFSEEFYGHVKRYLADDGLLVQWLHIYELDFALVASIFKALERHFPDYAVYAWNPGDLYVVASPRGPLPRMTARIFGDPLMAADLAALGVRGLEDLEALRLGTRRSLGPLFAHAPVPANSDYYPIVDQRAPRARFKSANAVELRELRNALEPVLPLLDGEVRSRFAPADSYGRGRPPHVDRAAAGLEALRIVEGDEASRARFLSAAERSHAVVAGALMDNCERSGETWLRAFAEVVRVVSVLPREDLGKLFARARAGRCVRSLDAIRQRRFAWLEAMAMRDAPAISREAEHLIEHDTEAFARDRTQYYVSAVAAAVSQGRLEHAREFADRNARHVSPPDRRRLLVRLAVSAAFTGQEGK